MIQEDLHPDRPRTAESAIVEVGTPTLKDKSIIDYELVMQGY